MVRCGNSYVVGFRMGHYRSVLRSGHANKVEVCMVILEG